MASLQTLSTEILLRIGKLLKDADLAHLSETNGFLSEMFSEILVTRSMEDKPRVVQIPALTWAIDHTKKHLVQRILSRANFSPNITSSRSALHDAAVYGDCEIMAMLLRAGYDPNRTIAKKRTALHICAMYGHAKAAKLLIDNGANISAKDRSHKTAFFLAIESSKRLLSEARLAASGREINLTKLISDVDHRLAATVRVLAENGAQHEVSTPNALDFTALYLAVCSCIAPNNGPDMTVGTEVIRFLVGNGALPAPDHTQTANNGRTPLQAAVAYGTASRNALSYFLDIGSNPNFKDQTGRDLLSEATAGELETFPVVELLLNRGAIIDDNFDLWAIFEGLVLPEEKVVDRLITLLLVHGADFGSIAGKCFTVAAYHGMLEVMKSIFTSHAGTDINTPINLWDMLEDDMKTPLEIALSLERQDILEFLIANGVAMTQGEKILVGEVLGREIN